MATAALNRVLLILVLLATAVGRHGASGDGSFYGAKCTHASTWSPANHTEFRANVMALLTRLPSAAAPTGFASLRSGSAAGQRAFARGICFADQSLEQSCLDCLSAVAKKLADEDGCAISQRGAAWSDGCFLHFADTGVSSPDEETYRYRNRIPFQTDSTAASKNSAAGKRRSSAVVVMVAVALSIGTLLFLILIAVLVARCGHKRRRIKGNGIYRVTDNTTTQEGSMCVKPAQFTLSLLRVATGNFAAKNKLAEGGFGEVFKGKLQDGQVVAVQRLSQLSWQGFQELNNELEFVSKVKHRNLVQLLGVCLGEQERLIVYEYLPNRNLDTLLFDSKGRSWDSLDWRRRYTIISGIAHGLQHLHELSPLRIIHRDLKTSNILLDDELNPKISYFGLAQALWADQSKDAITKRAASTSGYISPEYVCCGQVSTKSFIFSFGVIVLEIVTGRRNNSPCEDAANHASNLLSYVWDKWKAGLVAEAVDASLRGQYPHAEMLNCVQVGLLCVQEKRALRPNASAVALMLQDSNFTSSRQAPSRPAYFTS